METKVFVDGLSIKEPRDGAPDFVKAAITIKRADLGNWLRARQDEWINIDVKVSKAGKWYCEVNSWVPKQQLEPHQQSVAADVLRQGGEPFTDDIPF